MQRTDWACRKSVTQTTFSLRKYVVFSSKESIYMECIDLLIKKKRMMTNYSGFWHNKKKTV